MQAPKSRSPSRRARSRNARVLDSSSKSMLWNPAYGAVRVSNLPDASQSKRPESTSTPAIATPWPPRNLVAEWYSRSAPSSKGFISTGVVKVESTSSGTLAACAICATAGMSSTSRPGLPSVSPKRSRVLGLTAFFHSSKLRGLTKVVSMPKRLRV